MNTDPHLLPFFEPTEGTTNNLLSAGISGQYHASTTNSQAFTYAAAHTVRRPHHGRQLGTLCLRTKFHAHARRLGSTLLCGATSFNEAVHAQPTLLALRALLVISNECKPCFRGLIEVRNSHPSVLCEIDFSPSSTDNLGTPRSCTLCLRSVFQAHRTFLFIVGEQALRLTLLPHARVPYLAPRLTCGS